MQYIMDLYPEFFILSIKLLGLEFGDLDFEFWGFCSFKKNLLSYLCNANCVAFLKTARGVVGVAHGGALSGLRSALLLQRGVGAILDSSPSRGAARPGLPKAR